MYTIPGLRLGLHWRKLFRLCDESGMFLYWIGFAVYTQVDESEIKTPRFGHVSGNLNPKFKVGTLNPKTFESGEFCCVYKRFSLESRYFSACELLSLW